MEWMNDLTNPYSIIQSPCKNVNIALMGMLSDETGLFRDNTFKGIPIGNVLDTYAQQYNEIVTSSSLSPATLCIPVTHQSMQRDKELAEHMISLHGGKKKMGVIIGGHEHEPLDEQVGNDEIGTVRIVKSGMDARAVSLIDLSFETFSSDDNNNNDDDNQSQQQSQPQLVDIDVNLVEMSSFEPSLVITRIVDNHMSVIKALEEEYVVDADSVQELPSGSLLTSERTRFEQTTVGSIFCKMIKDETEADAAIINGGSIKGSNTFPNGKMSYAQLKKELPFPTKMVVIPMARWELEEAIHFSRTNIENGQPTTTDGGGDDDGDAVMPRRGFLQVDPDFQTFDSPDDIIQVATPRNLLNGFCGIKPLMKVGERLKHQGQFPEEDDFVPAIDLIVRYACKNRWYRLIGDSESFHQFDLNQDGYLDRDEVKKMMESALGHEPADFLVDDMMSSIDTDANGVIDKGEFSYLLATMERKHSWKIV